MWTFEVITIRHPHAPLLRPWRHGKFTTTTAAAAAAAVQSTCQPRSRSLVSLLSFSYLPLFLLLLLLLLHYLCRMVPLPPPPVQILGISGTPYLIAPFPFSSAATTIATVSATTITTIANTARQKASDAQQYSSELQQELQAGYITATCISVSNSNTDEVFSEAKLQAAVERFGSSDDVWSTADFMSCGFFPTSQSLLTENVYSYRDPPAP